MSIQKLTQLEKIYEEAQYSTHILKQSDQIPFPVLVVNISDVESEAEQVITFTFFPREETEFEAIECLQLFTQLPFNAPSLPSVEVWRYLCYLNRKLPFATFQYAEDAKKFEFRHIITSSFNDKIQADFFEEMLELSQSLLDMFTPTISELYHQKISFKEAVNQSALE